MSIRISDHGAGSGASADTDEGFTAAANLYAVAPMYGTSTTRPMTNQRLIAARTIIRTSGTISLVAASVTTAATSGTGRLGVYADSNGVPGALVVDAGTINLNSATSQTVAVSQALDAGTYWLAVLVESLSGAGAFRASAGMAGGTPFGSTTQVFDADNNGVFADGVVAGALPASFPAYTPITSAVRLAVKFA